MVMTTLILFAQRAGAFLGSLPLELWRNLRAQWSGEHVASSPSGDNREPADLPPPFY